MDTTAPGTNKTHKPKIAFGLPLDAHFWFFTCAFSLFHIEHYNVFENPLVLELCMPGIQDATIPTLAPISIGATCFGFLTLFLLYSQKQFFINDKRGLLVCCTFTFCAALLWSIGTPSIEKGFLGLTFFSFGHLSFLPSIVKNLAVTGRKRSLLALSISVSAKALYSCAATNMPKAGLLVIIAITPFAAFFMFRAAAKQEARYTKPSETAKIKIPTTLFITMILSGILTQTEFARVPSQYSTATSAIIAALITIAISIALITSSKQINFNKLIYLVSFPLMAFAIGILVAKPPLDLPISTVVFLLGDNIFYAAIWALWGYLVRYAAFNHYWLAICGSLGGFIGRSCVAVLSAILTTNPACQEYIPFAMLCAMMISLIFATAYYGQNNMKTGWGMIAVQSGALTDDPIEEKCKDLGSLAGLSPREKDVLVLLAKGKNCKTIAETLSISAATAKTHIKHIYRKVDVHSQQELILLVESADTQLHK